MGQETEKQQYEKKAAAIAEKIDKILKMQSGDIITGEMRRQLEKIQEDADMVHHKLKNNEFEIAIVGLEKAGKSSFSNALMEKELLPTGDQRCTYTATCIKYGTKDRATVKFYGRDVFERDFSDKLKKVGIENADSYSYRTLTMEKYEDLYESRREQGSRFDETLNEDIRNIIKNKDEITRYLGMEPKEYEEEELAQSEFKDFITKPARAIAVEEVQIGSGKLEKMKNAVIYDVPGFNSPTEMHKEQTLQKMRSADAIVMVAKGDEPSVTGDVLKIFHESDNDGTELKEKLFVFANKSERGRDFQVNRQKTYKEWIDRYRYIDGQEKWRIVFGSAMAHLQKCGHVPGDDLVRAVEEKGLPDGDGIEAIRSALEHYNETRRFEVLKRRINKMQEDLKEIFKDVSAEYSEGAGGESFASPLVRLTMEAAFEAAERIPESLDELRGIVREDMAGNPLSQQIQEKIDCLISAEAYAITDEEIKKLHNRFTDSRGTVEFQKVNNEIRTMRFHKMYDEFCKNVVDMVLGTHKRYEEAMIDRCLAAIGIKKGTRNEAEVRKKIKELFAPIIGSEEENFYQSLVERFSRDIYEVLIWKPYGSSERLDRFYQDIDNFYSLAIFYKTGHEEKKIAYINEKIGNLPMCRMLLLHRSEEAKKGIEKAQGQIKALFTENLDEILKLVGLISRVSPLGVADIVAGVCRELEGETGDAETKSYLAREALRRELAREQQSGTIFTTDMVEEELFRKQYETYHSHQAKDYDSLKKDFLTDVEVLRDILRSAFVNAINIEKPFVAKEHKMIEDIQKIVKSREFRDFIEFNMPLIKYAECEDIGKEESRRRFNAACLRDIRELLAQVA